MLEVEPAQALAFRVAGHNLHERTTPLAAVAACGLQASGPGEVEIALRARADGELDGTSVTKLNAMRGAPYVVPREEASAFTAALVPESDDELKHFVGSNTMRELRRVGISPREALDAVVAAAREGLAAGPLGRDDFHQALRERVGPELLPRCPACGSYHVRPGLWRALGPLGVTQLPAKATLELADYPRLPLEEARTMLVRRFLHCYGPATPRQLAAWAQTSPAHAQRLFDLVELEAVQVEGTKSWILAEDRARLEAPPKARGVRLLTGIDPYVTQPDRDTLVPDPALRKRLFGTVVGRPGVVLHGGVLAGLWRGRKERQKLRLEVEWLGRRPVRLGGEAEAIARIRGCRTVDVVPV